MISFLPFQTMFLLTLMTGTLLSIAAPSWFLAWLGLEVNLLSFIPLMTTTTTGQEGEGAVKYFLSQAAGSTLLLIGSMLAPSPASLILTLGLLIKLGMPPCHFWFPMVMNTLPWTPCILLTTWQKLAPLTLISYAPSSIALSILPIIAGGSALLGGFMGMNQSQLRPLLAYSSIGHLGWMLMVSTISPSTTITYFLLYSLTTITIMLLLSSTSANSLHSLSSPMQKKSPHNGLTALLLLSLGGLPPLLGFIPKLLALNLLAKSSLLLMSLPLILGSLTNLFYYLSFSFILLLPINASQKTLTNPPLPFMLNILIIASLAGAPLIPSLLTL